MNLTPGQKKVLAIVVISIFLLIEILLLAVLVGNILNGTPNAPEFLFVMAIFAFPLWWAFRLLKSAKTKSFGPGESLDSAVQLSETNALVQLQTKIELPRYRKLLYLLTYTSPMVVFIHVIGLGMLTFYLLNPQPNWFVLFIVFFLLFLPISVYRTASANYKSTQSLHEPITYAFGQESFTVMGESFNTTMQWKALYKVRETKEWFLLYTNRQIAMLVPKDAFSSVNDIDTFRKLTAGVQS